MVRTFHLGPKNLETLVTLPPPSTTYADYMIIRRLAYKIKYFINKNVLLNNITHKIQHTIATIILRKNELLN